MKKALSEISSLLKEALAVAETVDHFKGAVVSLDLSCFDGSGAAVTKVSDFAPTHQALSMHRGNHQG